METQHPGFQHDISAHKNGYVAESYGTQAVIRVGITELH
jgi:hypothetical protein